MSELIHMRQRIKAVETIKKITHAMRLISMSSHVRLRAKKTFLEEYRFGITNLFERLLNSDYYKNRNNNIQTPESTGDLVILVGSQKGLCGNFNTNLYIFFEHSRAKSDNKNLSIITVGKKATEYAQVGYGNIIMHFDQFSFSTSTRIVQQILNHILSNSYASIKVYNNYPKTFFIQKPQVTQLLPIIIQSSAAITDDYEWYQSPEDILMILKNQLLFSTLQDLFAQSLIAEQAARFIAMDSATQNASNLLDTMRLNYNKLRQTKITRELTDLASSF